jgi:AsmA-like protein
MGDVGKAVISKMTFQLFHEKGTPSFMTSTTSAAVAKAPAAPLRHSPPRFKHRGKVWALSILLIVLFIAVPLYIRASPFSERSILQQLQEASDSQVTIRGYHRTHFPSPGAVVEGVEFRHGPNAFTFLKIGKLVIKGTYLGLLRQHVLRVKAEGAQVFIPPFGSNFHFQTQHSTFVVDEVIANGTMVEFEPDDPHDKPVMFDVHDAFLTDVRWGSPIHYQLKFRNPEPPGEISVHGDFGAWTTGHPQDTPISGEYSFEHADLGVYSGIAGLLSSTGKFQGLLQHIDVSGTTETPDFEVTSGGHKVKLVSQYDGYVDAMHGDTFLKRVEAKFGRTTILAEGSVAGTTGQKGKFAQFQLSAQRARIEDLLGLFVSRGRSPMSGPVSLRTRAQISPGDDPFLKKTRLDGNFGIAAGKFENRDTQQSVEELSAGARGENKEDPETVVSDLSGSVALVGGVAQFSDLSFGVPGAHARMHGTYDVMNHKIDLHGRMRVDTKISNTSTGVKSLLLKVMDPIFKKKKKGEIVLVHILGTYEKPEFGLDLTQGSNKKQPAK